MQRPIKNIVLTGLLSAIGLSSCGPHWTAIYDGSYEGKPYRLESGETKTFTSNRIEYRFRLGDLPSVEISALTTDWGPPYSDDIFGTAAYEYTTDDRKPYSNEPDTEAHGSTMIYLSPERFSEEDYARYAGFMKAEWHKIDSAFAGKAYSRFPRIVGLAYGRQGDFMEDFHGVVDGKKMILRIENDGRVRFINDDTWRNESYSGLSQKVQMPGKKLYLNTTPHTGLTAAQLLQLRNKYGASPDKRFEIIGRPEAAE